MLALSPAEFDLLKNHKLLERLDRDQREIVAEGCHALDFSAGEAVVRQGDDAESFFVVLSGNAEVHINTETGVQVNLGRLQQGQWFGEQALLSSHRKRLASVRAMTPLRCAVMPRALFESEILAQPTNLRIFTAASAEQLLQRLIQSLDALRGLEFELSLVGSVRREQRSAGEVIFHEGDVADAVYFVLSGAVAVLRERDGRQQSLAFVGIGQCFGERGVTRRRPRGATAVAASQATLLRIEAATFRSWVRQHPQLRDFLGTLDDVYVRGDGQQLSVFRGTMDGYPSIGTISGDLTGDTVVSCRVIGADILMVSRTGAAGERSACFEGSDGARRTLQLTDVVEQNGRLVHAVIVGVSAKRIGPDVREAIRHVFARTPLPASAFALFRKTGHLGGAVDLRDPERLCSCLRLSSADVLRAAQEVGRALGPVQAATGVTMLCGACEADVCALLQHADASYVTARKVVPAKFVPSFPLPVPHVTEPDIRWRPEALEALSTVPEFQLMAVASIFAPQGERFMIRAVSEALSQIDDPELLAHAEAFLAQESNHVTAHAPLNALLLELIYPENKAMQRLNHPPFALLRRLPLRVCLAISAAFEGVADASFATFFEHFYGPGQQRHHPDPQIHELAQTSGVAQLFHWHGREELGHRHVAFEVMRALQTPYPLRVLGFLLLMALSLSYIMPAVWSLRRLATRPVQSGPKRTALTIAWRTLTILRPRYDPGRHRYTFEEQLRDDAPL